MGVPGSQPAKSVPVPELPRVKTALQSVQIRQAGETLLPTPGGHRARILKSRQPSSDIHFLVG